MTDAVTGRPLSIHWTYLRGDRLGKADVPKAKRFASGLSTTGGCIRLWPDEDVTSRLAIAEGIETALSVAHVAAPVWATADAGNLQRFPVLPGIEALSIFADHDPAGIAAAEECADRWSHAGREVRVLVPPVAGTDWNDVQREAS